MSCECGCHYDDSEIQKRIRAIEDRLGIDAGTEILLMREQIQRLERAAEVHHSDRRATDDFLVSLAHALKVRGPITPAKLLKAARRKKEVLSHGKAG